MLKSILYAIVYAAFSASGITIIKYQMKGKTLETIYEWLNFVFNIPFVIGFIFMCFSVLSFFKALSLYNASFIIPVATGFYFVLLFSLNYFLFEDRTSYLSLLGLLLIISGIAILSINNHTQA